MKYRKYKLKLSGEDQPVITLLTARLPETYNSLGDIRETARAIQRLFPKVRAEIISLQRPQPAQAMRVRML